MFCTSLVIDGDKNFLRSIRRQSSYWLYCVGIFRLYSSLEFLFTSVPVVVLCIGIMAVRASYWTPCQFYERKLVAPSPSHDASVFWCKNHWKIVVLIFELSSAVQFEASTTSVCFKAFLGGKPFWMWSSCVSLIGDSCDEFDVVLDDRYLLTE